MSSSSPRLLLDTLLRTVPRRHRAPPLPAPPRHDGQTSPALALATVIEAARVAATRGEAPDAALADEFVQALVRLIRDALHPDTGDPAFQAMVLRQHTPRVREYASLTAHAERDRRALRALVNAIAHPARQERTEAPARRDLLARLHEAAGAQAWPEVADAARRLQRAAQDGDAPELARGAARVLEAPALARLARVRELTCDEQVLRYRALWNRHGPRPGSRAAVGQGAAAQRRGAAVETLAATALGRLAERLTAIDAGHVYRVVTSLRVPGTLAGNTERAKTEWDVVLLRSAGLVDTIEAWDVCLLVEAKASADAATTDFPRLLRGLRLLTGARADLIYTCATRQGPVPVRGNSLRDLPADEDALERHVLYCCDTPGEAGTRPLSPAARMQLLGTPPSLAFAECLMRGEPADARGLTAVWQWLTSSPRWAGVLGQYETLRRVRALMVDVTELAAALDELPAA